MTPFPRETPRDTIHSPNCIPKPQDQPMNAQQPSRFVGAALTLAFVTMGYGAGSLSGQTANLDLTLTLVTPTPTCSATIDAVDFGVIEAGSTFGLGSDNSQFFDLNFNCTGAVTGATATFDPGMNPLASQRRLAEAGGAAVWYVLEHAPTFNIIDHDEALGFDLISGPSTLSLRAYLGGSQTLPNTTGTYQDQVTVTFTF